MRNRARQNDQQGANRRKNRSLNEKINQTCTSSSCRAVRDGRLLRIRLNGLTDRLNGRTVNEELGAGDNDLFARLQPAVDRIVVADGVAQA